MLKEFREFVNQGNALDLAVGVIIGAAFGKIVNSIVTDLIMPIVSIPLGSVNFKDMYVPLAGQPYGLSLEKAREGGKAVIAYGAVIQTAVEFLIVAFTVFILIRQINRWRGPVPAKT